MDENFIVDYSALGVKIKQKRVQLGLSQEFAAEQLELSESFYSRIERGERILSVESLVKIANYFDLSLDYLLLDSTQSSEDDKLRTELDNIFKDKNPAQSAFLLNLLKVHSENIERLLT